MRTKHLFLRRADHNEGLDQQTELALPLKFRRKRELSLAPRVDEIVELVDVRCNVGVYDWLNHVPLKKVS